MEWARNHVTWTRNDLAAILFTDESRFYINCTDRGARVWRRPNERFAPVCITERSRYGGGSAMVCVGISS